MEMGILTPDFWLLASGSPEESRLLNAHAKAIQDNGICHSDS